MDDLGKTRIKMNNNYDVDKELYLKCKNTGCNDVLSPINWLYNQNKMLLKKFDLENRKEYCLRKK